MRPSDDVRMAETEAVFREVNERIAEVAGRFGSGEAEFVCECADPVCTHRVEASLGEYADVRADGTRFLLAPGHEVAGAEKVVARRRRHHVVKKVKPTVAALVARLDPRASRA